VTGHQLNTGAFDYGTGNITGTANINPVLVKYNSAGTVQWAKTSTASADNAYFYSVAIDSGGSVYVAGHQLGTGAFDYGSGSITGTSVGNNPVLVKYNSAGTAQWAKTITAGAGGASCFSVAVDSGGNVYTAGYQSRNGNYNYGSGNIAGTVTGSPNPVLVKYNSAGTAQWAKSITAGTGEGQYFRVTVDSAGSVYVAGHQLGTGAYDYGSGSIAGTSTSNNPVLVKYNSAGTAQWAKTITAGTDFVQYFGVTVDSGGNVYAAGHQKGTVTYNYGDGKIAAGTSTAQNPVLVKYGN
jgi:outer membrane protein assembly factor BamB